MAPAMQNVILCLDKIIFEIDMIGVMKFGLGKGNLLCICKLAETS